jgi:isoquinoline 1-oxidoreductase beta subunit
MYAPKRLPPVPSRRSVLKAGLAGGFLVAFHIPAQAANEPEQLPDSPEGQFAPNAFIRIDRSGKTTLVMPQVEMGQGVYTSVSMILAEELDADFSQVAVVHAPPNEKLYANPFFGVQVTGNSNSVRAFWKPLRQAGAAARAMLVQAAANQWQVEPASCSASNGKVTHAASARTVGYGDLVDAAGGLPEEFHADRQALQAPRHPRQDQWQSRLRHRCDVAGHEVRDARAVAGLRRQSRSCRR